MTKEKYLGKCRAVALKIYGRSCGQIRDIVWSPAELVSYKGTHYYPVSLACAYDRDGKQELKCELHEPGKNVTVFALLDKVEEVNLHI